MSFNDIVQIGGVALALVLCVIWAIRRVKARRNGNAKCSGCELSEICRTKSKPDCKRGE